MVKSYIECMKITTKVTTYKSNKKLTVERGQPYERDLPLSNITPRLTVCMEQIVPSC